MPKQPKSKSKKSKSKFEPALKSPPKRVTRATKNQFRPDLGMKIEINSRPAPSAASPSIRFSEEEMNQINDSGLIIQDKTPLPKDMPWWALGHEREPEDGRRPPYARRGWGLSPENQEHLCFVADYSVKNFISTWGVGNWEEAEKTFTLAQKQAMLDSIEGYYRPGLDWQSLKDLLSPSAQRNMLSIVAHTLLNKEIYETMVRNPFHFLDGADDSITGSLKELPSPPESLAHYFYHLWHAMTKVDQNDGHMWRWLTLRLLNGVTRNTTSWQPLGCYMMRRRRAAMEKFATRLFDDSSSILRLFLRELEAPEDFNNRRKSLFAALEAIDNISIGFAVTDSYTFIPSFTPIKTMGKYQGDSISMRCDNLNCIDDREWMENGGTVPESRNVVFVTRTPMMRILLDKTYKDHGKMMPSPFHPAYVVVESAEITGSKT